MSTKFQAPRGTHDVLPRDHLWWRVIRTIEEQCGQYGWSRVSTPGFEETALFERTAGEASDVVHKEMYTFVDRGDRSLTPYKAAMQGKIKDGAPYDIKLAKAVPVIWVYLTGWSNRDGPASFRDDVYGVDAVGEAQVSAQASPVR